MIQIQRLIYLLRSVLRHVNTLVSAEADKRVDNHVMHSFAIPYLREKHNVLYPTNPELWQRGRHG